MIGSRIKEARQIIGMTQKELGQALGGKGISTVSEWESGKRSPDIELLPKLAQVLCVSQAYLLGVDERQFPEGLSTIEKLPKQSVPLIGEVAAGQPILATESYDIYVDSPANADYALRVKGDSMAPTYLDGDIVYIKMADYVPEGTVAVVLLDDEACIKHVYYIPNGVQLVSDNPKYPPMICTMPEYDNIRVLGSVVGYTRMYRA